MQLKITVVSVRVCFEYKCILLKKVSETTFEALGFCFGLFFFFCENLLYIFGNSKKFLCTEQPKPHFDFHCTVKSVLPLTAGGLASSSCHGPLLGCKEMHLQ